MKRFFAFAMVLVVFALLVSSVSMVGASASQTVNGSWQFTTVTPISARPFGNTCLIQLAATSVFHGDLEGTLTNTANILHLGPCDQPASEVFYMNGSYQGSVGNVSGTFEIQGAGKGDAQGILLGQLAVLGGTGGLAGLHGQITLTGQLPIGGAYSGNVFFG